ncbi:MAG: hypothetical protein LUQ38_08980 [Methanotrichaceae archaeon]|nr:hypothetical protein [Methanotrichaceae archaeon]
MGWEVNVTKVISGSEELQGTMISAYLTSANPAEYPRGFLDPNIKSGDSVDVYGEVDYCEPDWGCAILLTGSSDYYIKRTDTVIAEQENETGEYAMNPEDMSNIPALSNLTSNLNATANIILFPNMTINMIVIQNTTMNDFLVPAIDVMAKSPLGLMAVARNVTNS